MKTSFFVSLLVLLGLTISVDSLADTATLGTKIYNTHCVACHLTGVANAPKAHDVKAWQARFTLAKQTAASKNSKLSAKKLDAAAYNVFIQTIKKGKGAMPPGGMCPKCSNKEYKAAILFMMQKK
ncbi:MAG: c-type cytochrome [Gammaproteobacteria bacterium]|nr:c-type cytochrome [Gammaproteobacteria bacterium]